MRICTTKAGALIEMQSEATEGTLVQNALNAGYKAEDVEEREISTAEWKPMQEALKPVPTYRELRAPQYPPAEDYLDAIVKGDQAQVQRYIDACLAVKAAVPKT